MQQKEAPYNVAVAASYLCSLIAAFAVNSAWPKIAALVCSGIFLYLHKELLCKRSFTFDKVGLLVLVLLVCAPVYGAKQNEMVIYHLVVELLMLLAAYILVMNPECYLRVLRGALLVVHSAIFLFLVKEGLADYPLERFVPGASSNGITSCLIVIQASYFIAKYVTTRSLPIFTSTLTFLVCFIGFGRASLVAAILLMLLSGTYHLLNILRKTSRGFFISAWVLLAVGIFLLHGPIIEIFDAYTKLHAGLYDSARFGMLSEYVSSLNIWSLLVGGDYAGTSIATHYGGNPHNSYIRGHYLFGLPYLLAVILLPLIALSHVASAKEKFVLGFVFMVVGMRAFTETVLFPTVLDVFYFSSCFLVCRLYSRPELKRAT